jgi:putative membrane protein
MFKRILLVTAIGACTALSAGCHKTGDNAGKDLSHPSDSAPVNAAQDVAATAVGAVAAPVAAMTTESYVANAAIADMYEVEAGKIAQQRAKRADVKAFAAMMVKDHTATTAGPTCTSSWPPTSRPWSCTRPSPPRPTSPP